MAKSIRLTEAQVRWLNDPRKYSGPSGIAPLILELVHGIETVPASRLCKVS